VIPAQPKARPAARPSQEPYAELRIGGFRLTIDRRPRLVTTGRIAALASVAVAVLTAWLRPHLG
jgi:hypothetical protein